MKSVQLFLTLSLFASLPAQADELSDLRRAVETDNVRGVHALIESGKVTPDTRVLAPGVNKPGIPILGLAAREGSVSVTDYLIRAKADLNQRTPYNETPLMMAAFFNDQSNGDSDPTPQYFKHEKIARMLVENGADLENLNEYNPLTYSVFNGHMRTTRFLLDRGARVNSDAVNGRSRVPTALMIAAMNGDRATANLLLDRGADTCIRDGWDHDAAYMAKKYDHLEMLPLVECKKPEA